MCRCNRTLALLMLVVVAVGAVLLNHATVVNVVAQAIGAGSGGSASSQEDLSKPSGPTGPAPRADGFHRVRGRGSVQVETEYDLAGLTIPEDEIHTLLPRDAIPALTDPKTQMAEQAEWLSAEARIIEIVVGDDVLGVPLRVLDWHEIANTTVGGEPIAATYCPLCDSATVFSRRVTKPGGGSSEVLEFGVSGALYNSNVLMYDKQHKGLWSQLAMHAVSGPLAGTALDTLPVEVVSFAAFKAAHPGARIISNQTGHDRDYGGSPYEGYMKNEGLMVPVARMGTAIPQKTLGLGVSMGEGLEARAWFVPIDVIAESFTLDVPAGRVMIKRSEAGVAVAEAPKGVRTAQTFYYSWSAFYPATIVVKAESASEVPLASASPGLVIGDKAPDVAVTAIDGQTVSLASLYQRGPIVLTFYRGGWCPICTRALSQWHNRLNDVKAAGGTFIALTPEMPDLAAATIEKSGGGYEVYSDSTHAAAKAFKVHFVVDDQTRAKYEQYGLKVTESNVSGTWELPAPATFVIDREGTVRWAYAESDYTKRADPDEVIAAVRALSANPQALRELPDPARPLR